MANEPPNDRFLDRFSIVHAAVGAVMELSAIPAPVALAAQAVFEIVENPIKESVRSLFPDPTPDAWQNSMGDIASFAAGYYGARALKGSSGGMAALATLGAAGAAIWIASLAPRTPQLKAAAARTGRKLGLR